MNGGGERDEREGVGRGERTDRKMEQGGEGRGRECDGSWGRRETFE